MYNQWQTFIQKRNTNSYYNCIIIFNNQWLSFINKEKVQKNTIGKKAVSFSRIFHLCIPVNIYHITAYNIYICILYNVYICKSYFISDGRIKVESKTVSSIMRDIRDGGKRWIFVLNNRKP